ncbi:hypothetical protein PENTCL1PPCAC_29604, partial [Pristionchus entomophagus]
MCRELLGVDLIPNLLQVEDLLLVLYRFEHLVHALARDTCARGGGRVLLLHSLLFLVQSGQGRADEIRSKASRSVHTVLRIFITIAVVDVVAPDQREIVRHRLRLVGTRSVVRRHIVRRGRR